MINLFPEEKSKVKSNYRARQAQDLQKSHWVMGSFLKQLNYVSFWALIYKVCWSPQCCGELGYEQQWRDRAGYRLNVYFKVTSEKEDEIVVEYSSHRHEEQEQNDALSKQVTRSAEETEVGKSTLLMCITSWKNPQTLDSAVETSWKTSGAEREWANLFSVLHCQAVART